MVIYLPALRANPLVDTDAQVRPLPAVAPADGRRSHAR